MFWPPPLCLGFEQLVGEARIKERIQTVKILPIVTPRSGPAQNTSFMIPYNVASAANVFSHPPIFQIFHSTLHSIQTNLLCATGLG